MTRRLSPHEARELLGTTNAVLLDVRSHREFAAVRASGAVCVPLADLAARHSELPVAQPVIAICAGGNRSRVAVETLRSLGVNILGDVSGGTRAWEAAGLPVERSAGAPPMDLERQVRLFAGALVAGFTALGFWASPLWHIGVAFIGTMLALTAALGICPMMDALRLLPWNRPTKKEAA